MWFLKGRPTSINVWALIASVANGYQQTSYRFRIEAEEATTKDGKVWIAIAIPWAPHKPNGSLTFIKNNLLALLEENSGNTEQATILKKEDVEIYERLRSLKTSPDIELVHVQDMIQWYLDDIGVITFWAETGKTYQLDYSHKIASDSCLFLPTRLPMVIASVHKPKMDYKLWVVNGLSIDLKSQLHRKEFNPRLKGVLKESQETLDCFTISDWEWDNDTRIGTENWESSDDEWDSEEETA